MRSWFVLAVSWLTFLSMIGLTFFVGLTAFVGGFYHPNSPIVPYATYLTYVALAAIPASLALAVRHSFVFRKRTAMRLAGELGLFGAGLTVVALSALVLVDPVPASFLQHAGFDPYRVPSKYTALRNNRPGEDAGVRLDYCAEDLRGKYQRAWGPCDNATLTLSKRAIVNLSMARGHLKTHGIAHEDDRLLDVDAIQLTKHAGDGWIGFSMNKSNIGSPPYDLHIMLDPDGRLIRYVDCHVNANTCRIYARTALGTLSYRFFEGTDFQPDAWRAAEAPLLTLLSRFRVRSPS